MGKQSITLENVSIPEGYEATGEYRQAKKGEYYFDRFGAHECTMGHTNGYYIILRKVKPKPRECLVLYGNGFRHLLPHDWQGTHSGQVVRFREVMED